MKTFELGKLNKLVVTIGLALVVGVGMTLVGCSSPAPSSTSTETKAAVVDQVWQGDWTSQNEIAAPAYAMAQQTDKTDLKLTIEADGNWKIVENGATKYSGTAKPFETTYYQGENGTAETDLETTVNGKTVYMRLVNAQGVNKLIWNCGTGAKGGGAGASGDGTLSKYTFI